MIELRPRMFRVLCCLIIRLVAREALGRRSGKPPAFVAPRAGGLAVRTRKRELRTGVIERRRFPGVVGVAGEAVVVELRVAVVRGGGLVVCCFVTAETVGRLVVEAVRSRFVALVALERSVCAREWIDVMPGRSPSPAVRRVADSAIPVILEASVIGVGSSGEAALVAIVAGLRRASEAASDVAVGASRTLVPAGELEAAQVVVEAGGPPRVDVVTGLASLRDVPRHVVRIGRRGIGLLVTGIAGARGVPIAGRVAVIAVGAVVPTDQRERCRVRVSRPLPADQCDRMAFFTPRAEAGGLVIWRRCLAEGIAVATRTGDGGVRIAAALMTARAIDATMYPRQLESGLIVVLGHRRAVLPAVGGMAASAGRPELVVVNVAMAVGAPGFGLLEYQAAVALSAPDSGVPSGQREIGLPVIEAHLAGDRPAVAVMAGVAGDLKLPVRARLRPRLGHRHGAPTDAGQDERRH